LSDGALREPHVRGKCCDEGCRHEKHIDVGECSLPSQSRVDLQARMIDVSSVPIEIGLGHDRPHAGVGFRRKPF